MTESSRRLLLRLGVKLMGLTAVALVGYILIDSTADPPTETDTPPPLRLELGSGAQLQRLPWAGGNLLLLRRSPAQLAALAELEPVLADPRSRHASQPADLPSPGRSRHPDYFLAYNRGSDLGCPLQWVAAGEHSAPHQPWPGGFRDSCRGSWYDAAGRVFKNQQAGRNLAIPPYRLLKPDLLEVGGNGDNPASVK